MSSGPVPRAWRLRGVEASGAGARAVFVSVVVVVAPPAVMLWVGVVGLAVRGVGLEGLGGAAL